VQSSYTLLLEDAVNLKVYLWQIYCLALGEYSLY